MRTAALSILILALIAPLAGAQSTAFTYQGRLDNGAQVASGLHDFRFTLFDVSTGGVQLVPPQCVDNVTVTNGLFTTTIDFGQQFTTTSPRYLQIEVRADTGLSCANPAGLVLLGPRQLLTATPMASSAKTALTAFSLSAPDGSPQNAVFVDNVGAVGVGTTAPATTVHIAAADPVLILQDTGAASSQVGYVGFWNNAANETGWVGYGSPGVQHLSIVNARSGGHINLLPTANVGVGTSAPTAKLDVRGDIRLGPSGQYRAVSGEDNLRMLRGRIDGNGTINSGTGFTCQRLNEGIYVITFNTAFVGTPSITATCVVPDLALPRAANINNHSTTSVTIFVKNIQNSYTDSDFHFIIVGPR